jgi:hypothetical protein
VVRAQIAKQDFESRIEYMSRQAAIVSNKTISQKQARNSITREWDKPSREQNKSEAVAI